MKDATVVNQESAQVSEDATEVNGAAHLAGVERDLGAHLRALRRKLERAARRGAPVERLQARIRGEEELLRQMRGRRPSRQDTRGSE